MTTTFTKLSLVAVLVTVAFGVFGYVSNTSLFINEAAAQTSCGNCGTTGGSTGGGYTGGGGGDSYTPPPVTPVCNLVLNKTVAAVGESYRLTWSGSPSSASFFINGSRVASSGAADFTFTGPNYDRFRMVGNNGGVECEKNVQINAKPIETPVERRCDITASASVVNNGGSVTLTWNTTGYDTITINGEAVSGNSGTRTYTNLTQDTTYTLRAVTSDGKHNCAANVTVQCLPPPVVPEPICESFTANPTTITKNNSTTLQWSTKNATTLTINNGVGIVTGKTSQVVTPLQTTTYTLTVANSKGDKVTCHATVNVTEDTPVLPSCPLQPQNGRTIINFDGSRIRSDQGIDNSRTSIKAANLSSGTYNVTLVSWDGYIGRENASQPREQYVLSFMSGTNSVLKSNPIRDLTDNVREASATQLVNSGLVVPSGVTGVRAEHVLFPDSNPNSLFPICAALDKIEETPLPVCESFTVSPSVLPYGGGNVTLTWNTKDATNVSINNGVGVVTASGSVTRAITNTTTYILTAKNVDGDTVSCSAKVIVTPKDPTPISCEENVSFSANPNNFRRGGETTLNWSTTGITGVSFNQGINDTRLSGNLRLTPTSNTTYILTATDGTTTVNCPVPVTVTTGGGGGGTVTPRCELTASDRTIKSGERVTLRWNSTRAQDLVLVDSDNATLITTKDKLSRDKDEFFAGSLVVRPTENTSYTLTVTRGREERECTVTIEVEGSQVVVVENRDQQPLVSGISLTQVPYTGFEAGPFLTFVFYTLLLGWALYLAYVIVMKRGDAGLVPVTASTNTSPVIKESPATFSTAEYTKPSFHPAAPVNLPTSDRVLGYANQTEAIAPTIPNLDQAVVTAIENRAHAAHVLLSSDALSYFISTTEGVDRMSILDNVIAKVTAEYPTEDGWVVLNLERITNACAACMATTQVAMTEVAVGNSSLAEAIVTGNITAAYQMIGHRPMIALADAAADLDAAYRSLQGEEVTISNLLAMKTAELSAEKVQAAIKALTGALDGTYATEEEAVKMAIMKAVKAVS